MAEPLASCQTNTPASVSITPLTAQLNPLQPPADSTESDPERCKRVRSNDLQSQSVANRGRGHWAPQRACTTEAFPVAKKKFVERP